MRKLAILFLLMTLTALPCLARTWKLKDGKIIHGEFHRMEGDWLIITTDKGDKQPLLFVTLSDDDKHYARNLAAIFGNKPPDLDSTDPATRVKPTGNAAVNNQQPAVKPKKRAITISPVIPVPEQVETIIITEPAPTRQPRTEPKPAVLKQAVTTETSKTDITPTSANNQNIPVIVAHKSQIDSLRRPGKFISKEVRKTNIEHLARALELSLKKNRYITLYFLALCLLILIHKMHMPQLYKKSFRPKTVEPKGTQKREFDKDDDRERFRECPFCKMTNPTSVDKCDHCGQFIR